MVLQDKANSLAVRAPSTPRAPRLVATQDPAGPEHPVLVPASEPVLDLARPVPVVLGVRAPAPAEHRRPERHRVRSEQPPEVVAVVRSIQRPRKAR